MGLCRERLMTTCCHLRLGELKSCLINETRVYGLCEPRVQSDTVADL